MYFISHGGLWWRADRCGYTDNILEAGLYSEQEATATAKDRRTPCDLPFHVSTQRRSIESAIEQLRLQQINATHLQEILREHKDEQGTGSPHAGLAENTQPRT